MKLRAIVLAGCLIFLAKQAHAQVNAFFIDVSQQLTETCAGGNFLPDDAVVDVMWDQNDNGPDDTDELYPTDVFPAANFNQFQMNGDGLLGVPGGFATEPPFTITSGLPVPHGCGCVSV